MENSPAKRQDLRPQDTPGIGVAGKTLCPLTNGLCQKDACELWVELTYGEQKVGRCSYAWQPIILTEIRGEVEKLKESVGDVVKKEK